MKMNDITNNVVEEAGEPERNDVKFLEDTTMKMPSVEGSGHIQVNSVDPSFESSRYETKSVDKERNDHTSPKRDIDGNHEVDEIRSKKFKKDGISKNVEDECENLDGIADSVKGLAMACSRQDHTSCYFINSGSTTPSCRQNDCILGIDEAGRGPVLGPMVYGVAYVPKIFEEDLKRAGCDDSKQLTEEKRESIFDKLCAHSDKIGWEAEVISSTYISNCMLRRQKTSLNEISHNAAIRLVQRAIDDGARITEIFVDTVGPAEKYQEKLQGIFTGQKVTVRSKADAIYPIVGAASIVAKVTRDVALRGWDMSQTKSQLAATEEIPWGSGYPNDPVTKVFLMKTLDPIFGFNDVVRFSWSTCEKILEDSAISVDWDDEETTSKSKGNQKIRSFFANVDLTVRDRHRFLKERQLNSVADF